jgi:hypothetical protein
VPPQRLLAWRDGFLAAGQAHLAAIDEGIALLVGVMLLYRPDINRGWRVVYDGYGKVGVEETEKGEQVHYLSPMRPERPEETHAALKIDTKTYRDLQLTLLPDLEAQRLGDRQA